MAMKTIRGKPFPEFMEAGHCKLHAGINRCLMWCTLTG